MELGMLFLCEKHQVLNPIVGFVSVEMMDFIFASEFSVKVLFHNMPVLQDIRRTSWTSVVGI